jgi:DNA-binding LacI/PurR family transcriptional regulator
MMQTLCRNASKYGIKLLVFSNFMFLYRSHDDADKRIFEAINFDILDGLIVFPDYIRSEEVMEKLLNSAKEKNVPTLIIDDTRAHDESACHLKFGFTDAFADIVNHVFDYHHCTKVNFFAAVKDNPYSEARLDFYKEALVRKNLPFEESRVYYGFWEEKHTYLAAAQMIADWKDDMPEAVICANDDMALALADALFRQG